MSLYSSVFPSLQRQDTESKDSTGTAQPTKTTTTAPSVPAPARATAFLAVPRALRRPRPKPKSQVVKRKKQRVVEEPPNTVIHGVHGEAAQQQQQQQDEATPAAATTAAEVERQYQPHQPQHQQKQQKQQQQQQLPDGVDDTDPEGQLLLKQGLSHQHNTYNPAMPNTYDGYRQRQRDHRRRAHENSLRLKLAVPAAPKMDLHVSSGEDAFLARQRLSLAAAGKPMPSAILMLHFDSDLPRSDEALEDEVRSVCNEYGQVERCQVVRIPLDLQPQLGGCLRVFTQFQSVPEAERAHAALSGRSFFGGSAQTHWYEQSWFQAGRVFERIVLRRA